MKKLSVIIIGAGSRGTRYATIMCSDEMKDAFEVVGVAEPIEIRRKALQKLAGIPEDMCFEDWKDILKGPKLADVAVVSTSDSMHYEPAMAAIEKGYHLLLEKPIAPTAEECAQISNAAVQKNVKVVVCHVLRFAPFYEKVKELLEKDCIGDIQSAVFVEAVGNVHQSHSYVRGNWHSEKESSNMLLAKSCHDIDLIQWLLDKPCKYIQSFGSLSYFRKENAPAGAPDRCIEGCPHAETCEYNAMKLYYDDKDNRWFRCASTKKVEPTDEDVLEALRTTDYGKCVFHANNDVVDHQVVNMEFEDGVTVSFSMNAFNKGGRYLRLFGTKGELWAYMADKEIQVYTFSDKKTEQIPVQLIDESINSGHGGGDFGIVKALHEYLTVKKSKTNVAEVSVSCMNHLLVFAAEEARHNHQVVCVNDYLKKCGLILQ